ncbi:MAG: NAD-dependent epimerase/dehydratase family protein [Elusimicrobiota bacterium]
MEKKSLVTGSNGFIGSHLVESLISEGNSVCCMIRRTSNLKWIKDLSVQCVYGDFCRPQTLHRAVRDVDEIYHVGGIVRAIDRERFYKINSLGTKYIVDAVKKYNPGLKRFVYVSSMAAGNAFGKSSVSDYGESKLKAEEHVRKLENYTIVRPAAVYGPRDMDFLPVFKFALKGFFLMPSTDGYLSFIHVKDCVRGIKQAENKKEVFLTDGKRYTWEDVSNILGEVAGKKIKCIKVPPGILKLVGYLGDIMGRVKGKPFSVNSDKIKEMLAKDWCSDETSVNAHCDLKKGFSETLKWYREQGLI